MLSGEIDLEEIKDNGLSIGGEPHRRSRALGRKCPTACCCSPWGKYDAFPVDIWIDRIVRYFILRWSKGQQGRDKGDGPRSTDH